MRRLLRRSRQIYYSTVPEVDASYGVEASPNDPEIYELRHAEAVDTLGTSLCDFLTYRLIPQPEFTNTFKMGLYDAAIRRFGGRLLSREQIRAVVDAYMGKELALREQTARWRRAEAARKAENDKGRERVLS